jgi:CheY-like chemotaxis protein
MDREIARTLASAVGAALGASTGEASLGAARDAVQVLGFSGLDRVLAACQVHAGRPLPPEFQPVVDRVRRITAECAETGDLVALRRADAELAALAGEIESYEWSDLDVGTEGPGATVATLAVSRVVEELALAEDESRAIARRLRLLPPVAASVRAALDWLAPESLTVRSVRVLGEPSVLEVRLDQVNPTGITAAHRVLSAVGGNLGPALDSEARFVPGEWQLRVPAFAPRPTYLLVVQGGVRLALPWHSVLRLRVVKATDLEPSVRRLSHPVLDVPSRPTAGAFEYPVVLVAHGLKRAYLIADRLVWRMMADPCANEWGSPAPGLLETVRTDEDEIYWIAEPGRLLQKLELPELPSLRRAPPDPGLPTLTTADVEPLRPDAPGPGSPPPAAAPPHIGPGAPPAPLVLTTPVRGADAEPAAPAPPSGREPRPTETGEGPQAGASPRRALLAEDSLTARIFLSRLLSQQGFEVEAVSTAGELLARIGEDPWALVLADVDLPDGHGSEWLTRARQAVGERAPHTRLIALVRDARDLDAARVSGVSDALLKPYDRAELEALLARVGLDRPRS